MAKAKKIILIIAAWLASGSLMYLGVLAIKGDWTLVGVVTVILGYQIVEIPQVRALFRAPKHLPKSQPCSECEGFQAYTREPTGSADGKPTYVAVPTLCPTCKGSGQVPVCDE